MSQSLARGLSILDLFSAERPELTIEEIATEINMSPITSYRYVKTLIESDMLIMSQGNVQLSAKILRFVNLFWKKDDLVAISKDHIDALQQELNESIALCKLEIDSVICIYRQESSLALRSSFTIGERMSIHAGAFARSIAAFLPKSVLKAIMNNIEWTAFTENTITCLEDYEERLEIVKERGYDVSVEEIDRGIIALAVPILYEGRVLASIGLGLPSIRYELSETPSIISKLQKTANLISQEAQKSNFYFL